jgi:hypothetical protein
MSIQDQIRTKQNLKDVKAKFSEWLKAEKLTLIHPDMVPEWFMNNQRYIMDAVNAGCRSQRYRYDGQFFASDVFRKIRWGRSPVFNLFTSNTHVCPDNGETNWSRLNDKIKGYPGWSGQINGNLSRNKENDTSYPYGLALNLIGVKTGTGGGGNQNWAYDFSMFLADWPGFEVEYRKIEGDRIIAKLKGVQ